MRIAKVEGRGLGQIKRGVGVSTLLGKHYVHKGNNSRTYPGAIQAQGGGEITDGRFGKGVTKLKAGDYLREIT